MLIVLLTNLAVNFNC